MKIKIKKLSDLAVIPTKATPGAIAYDVTTPRDYHITQGRHNLSLDLALEIPDGYEAKIEPRSGHSSKGMTAEVNGYAVRANADVIVGKIDSDYRGCIGVIMVNHEPVIITIPAGTRIAQLTIYKGESVDFQEVETLSDTKRGDGGFGSTGSN